MNIALIDNSEEGNKPIPRGFLAVVRRMNRLFVFTVIVPTLLSVIYFGFLASDVYISESLIVVRSPERQSASSLGLLLKGAGFSRSQDDAYAVHDYILSRDALGSLDQKLKIKDAYSNKNVDLFSRFGVDWDESFEAFHLYFRKRATLQIDSLSSITTVTIRAYTADNAYRINEQLLELAEARVNELNERGRQDMIRFARQEVGEAEQKNIDAALALASYRNQKHVIDPEKQSAIPLQQIARLQDELIATKSQLSQVQMLAKNNPQIPVLKQRVDLLKSDIEAETRRVTGGGDRSLASKTVEYQRLALEKEFADKMLASAMSTLEQARSEAQRKQLYLERIAQPSKPDAAMEPHRISNIVAAFVLGLIAWGVLSLTVAAVKEHRD